MLSSCRIHISFWGIRWLLIFNAVRKIILQTTWGCNYTEEKIIPNCSSAQIQEIIDEISAEDKKRGEKSLLAVILANGIMFSLNSHMLLRSTCCNCACSKIHPHNDTR